MLCRERVIRKMPRQFLPAELPFQPDHILFAIVVEHGHKPHANQRSLLLNHPAQALLVGGAATPGVIGDDEPGEGAGRVSHFLFRIGADADRIKLQQFAAEVFVGVAPSVLLGVELEHQCRTQNHELQHLRELHPRYHAEHFEVVVPGQAVLHVVGRHRKVVEIEQGQLFAHRVG